MSSSSRSCSGAGAVAAERVGELANARGCSSAGRSGAARAEPKDSSGGGNGNGARSSPGSSHHHRLDHTHASGVLATTTTALVHNRLTHAAGGMLSTTLTGFLTLLLVLLVYRKSFLIPFTSLGSSSSRPLSITEYNTEYNRHIGASGTASGKAPPLTSPGLSGPLAARRSPRSPPPPHSLLSPPPPTPLPPPPPPSSTPKVKLAEGETVGDEGEVYRCIINTPLLKSCLRRRSPNSTDSLSPQAEADNENEKDDATSTASTSSLDASSSSLSSCTKTSVRVVEDPHSRLELDRLRSHWAQCATSPVCKGIGGYRSTRDIYAKGQGGDTRRPPSPPVASSVEVGMSDDNSLGLVLPASARPRRASPTPPGRNGGPKDSLRHAVRASSPIPARLVNRDGPAYLRSSSPAGSPSLTNRGPRSRSVDSEGSAYPRWVKNRPSTSTAPPTPVKPIQTIVVSSSSGLSEGTDDSEGYEDCSEGSGASTPVLGSGSPNSKASEGLRMSELIAKVVITPPPSSSSPLIVVSRSPLPTSSDPPMTPPLSSEEENGDDTDPPEVSLEPRMKGNALSPAVQIAPKSNTLRPAFVPAPRAPKVDPSPTSA